MLKRIDDGNEQSRPTPPYFQPAFAVLNLDEVQKWAWELSEERFCEKMRHEVGWQSTELGFRYSDPVNENHCYLSRHIRFRTRTEWLWIAGRCKGRVESQGEFLLFNKEPISGLSPEQVNEMDRRAAAEEFDFLRIENPKSYTSDQPIGAQLMTQGGFFMPTEHMAQERLQHVLRQDPYALLLAPEGANILDAVQDRELKIYSMSVDREWVEVRLERTGEVFMIQPYQLYHAVHTRGHDVNAF